VWAEAHGLGVRSETAAHLRGVEIEAVHIEEEGRSFDVGEGHASGGRLAGELVGGPPETGGGGGEA
jgi:hypothetical protein